MVSTPDVRVLADRVAICELKYRCCLAIDTNDADGLVDTFTEDGILQATRSGTSSPHLRLCGHDELGKIVSEERSETGLSRTQHRLYNPIIEVDGDTAFGHWYVSVVDLDCEADSVRFTIGTYDDEYSRVGGDWKIVETQAKYTAAEVETSSTELL